MDKRSRRPHAAAAAIAGRWWDAARQSAPTAAGIFLAPHPKWFAPRAARRAPPARHHRLARARQIAPDHNHESPLTPRHRPSRTAGQAAAAAPKAAMAAPVAPKGAATTTRYCHQSCYNATDCKAALATKLKLLTQSKVPFVVSAPKSRRRALRHAGRARGPPRMQPAPQIEEGSLLALRRACGSSSTSAPGVVPSLG